MWGTLATRLICALLRSAHISVQDRTLLTSCLLDKLGGFPMSDILGIDENGQLLVRGKRVDASQALILRRSARRLLREPSRKLVHDQVTFKAVTMGVHQGDTPEKVLFSKVALWWGQQEDELYKLFAQQEGDENEELDDSD